MKSKLVHPSLMAHLAGTHFNSRITIGHVVVTYDAANEPVMGIVADPDLINLPAYIEPIIGGRGTSEVRNKDQTIVVKAYTIMLAGYYPTISDDDQAVASDGRVFNIISVGTDDTNTLTAMTCERVNPSVSENA